MKKERFRIEVRLFDEETADGRVVQFIETKAYVTAEMSFDSKGRTYTYRERVNFPYFISHHECLLDIAKHKIKDLINKDYRYFMEKT